MYNPCLANYIQNYLDDYNISAIIPCITVPNQLVYVFARDKITNVLNDHENTIIYKQSLRSVFINACLISIV